jgi:hypothetical protein
VGRTNDQGLEGARLIASQKQWWLWKCGVLTVLSSDEKQESAAGGDIV